MVHSRLVVAAAHREEECLTARCLAVGTDTSILVVGSHRLYGRLYRGFVVAVVVGLEEEDPSNPDLVEGNRGCRIGCYCWLGLESCYRYGVLLSWRGVC